MTTANAVDTSTRTIVTELTVDNANGELWPGTYVSVHFTFPGDPNILILPEQALLFRAQGMQVAVVDGQNRVHLQDVVLGRNLDTDVEIVSGLKATDKVVGNPSLGLLDGQQVKIVQPVPGYQAVSSSKPGVPPQGTQPLATTEPSATAAAPICQRGPGGTLNRSPAVRARSLGLAARRPACLALAALIGLCSCDLAPNYVPPQYILPADYKGSGPFTIARPRETLPRGPWWEGFDDTLLNQLEQQLTADNPDLAALAEQYTQARDLAAEARSQLFPQVGANGLLSDNKESKHRLFRSPNSTSPAEEPNNEILATASWEPDFWSAIRNSTRVQKRLAQASAASLASARLSLQAELASDYIALRGLDTQEAVYRAAIAYYQKAVRITKQRLQGRIASALEWRAPKHSWRRRRHCRAALSPVVPSPACDRGPVGANPSSFSIPVADAVTAGRPGRAGGLPSRLLERRPDVASAERQMASANAGIGVSRAAFYPNISISAAAGFEDPGSTSRACRTPCGRSAPAPCCRFSRAASGGPRSSGVGPSTHRRATTIVRPCWRHSRRSRTAWP